MRNVRNINLSFFAVFVACWSLACEHGDTVPVEVFEPGGRRTVQIDRCIAPIVRALAKSEIVTLSSCCGHGTNGYIWLEDRILIITPRTNAAAAMAEYKRNWETVAYENERATRAKLLSATNNAK